MYRYNYTDSPAITEHVSAHLYGYIYL